MTDNDNNVNNVPSTDNKPQYKRGNRSFVIREGRMTDSQKRAFDDLWSIYGIEDAKTVSSLLENTPYDKISLDIGFGNGESLLKAAEVEPNTLHIGIEVHRPGIGSLMLTLEKNDISNVRVMHGDASEIIKNIDDNAISRALVFFPDPWHKKRHHKRRLVQVDFIDNILGKISHNGHLHLATDWQPYAEHMLEVTKHFEDGHSRFYIQNVIPLESHDANNVDMPNIYPFSPRPDYRPMTKYERRGVRLGHEVYDMIYQKKS